MSVIVIIEAEKNFLIRLVEGVACTTVKIKVKIVLTFQLTSYNFAGLKWYKLILNKCFCNFTWRLCEPHPPKYQKKFCKVAPQPYLGLVPSPYSKFKSSFIFPKQLESIFEKETEIFTIKINNEWLVTRFISTENEYSVSNWAGFYRCCCYWSSSKWSSCCFECCFWKPSRLAITLLKHLIWQSLD